MNFKTLTFLALVALVGAVMADSVQDPSNFAAPSSQGIQTAERNGHYGQRHKYKHHKKCYTKRVKHHKYCHKCYNAKKYKYVCDYKTKFHHYCYRATAYKKHCDKVRKERRGYKGHQGYKHGYKSKSNNQDKRGSNGQKYGHQYRMAEQSDGPKLDASEKTSYHTPKCYKKPYYYKKCNKKPYKAKKCYNKVVGTYKKCHKYYCPYYKSQKACWGSKINCGHI